MADNTLINAGAGGDTIAADDVGGVKFQRMKLVLGADGVNAGDVAAGNPLPVQILAASPATTVIGTVQLQTLTKGAQGTLGASTQDLKDAGRAIVNAATVIAGVACVAVEAMVALDVSRDFAVVGSATSFGPSGTKRLRITGINVGFISTAAAVLSGRVSLRVNPAGAAVVASPIHTTIALPSGAALAQAGGTLFVPIPDGLELTGAMQCGLSQIFSVATGTMWASIVAYEY